MKIEYSVILDIALYICIGSTWRKDTVQMIFPGTFFLFKCSNLTCHAKFSALTKIFYNKSVITLDE